jgi:cadmium resistance protein CadD (predicted permease)
MVRLMSMLAIIMVYVGINIDTFIALLFVIRRYRILTPMVGFILAETVLWIIGVVLGKTITTIFPDWITGLMGFVLLYLAFRSDDQEVQEAKNGIFKIFFLCLSLGGDNLAIYIPWAGPLHMSAILLITAVFLVSSVIAIYLIKLISNLRPLTFVLEKYGSYCTRIIYFCAGLYIIFNSRVLEHIVALL